MQNLHGMHQLIYFYVWTSDGGVIHDEEGEEENSQREEERTKWTNLAGSGVRSKTYLHEKHEIKVTDRLPTPFRIDPHTFCSFFKKSIFICVACEEEFGITINLFQDILSPGIEWRNKGIEKKKKKRTDH